MIPVPPGVGCNFTRSDGPRRSSTLPTTGLGDRVAHRALRCARCTSSWNSPPWLNGPGHAPCWRLILVVVRLLDAVRLDAAAIANRMRQSDLFMQMGDRGEFREQIIQEFLRPYLPPCYGLDPGEVFSSDGQQSAQVDIVVYDAVFSTVLFQSKTRKLFPAESVYGSIEVKSTLSLSELDRACANVTSVKKLSRRQADTLDLLPFLRLPLGPGLMGGGDLRNPYLGVTFAYKGVRVESVLVELARRLAEAPADRQLLPDFVFVGEPGYMVYRRRPDGTPAGPGCDFSTYGWIPSGNDTMALFFVTLITCLGELRLRRPDLNALWIQLVQECCQCKG